MKHTNASTDIRVTCSCPYCWSYQNIKDQLDDVDLLDNPEFDDENCIVTCDECSKEFWIRSISF